MQRAQHIITFNKDKPRNKWKKTTNASDDVGNKARKDKFYKPASLFPRLIFILFSFTLFLRLTTGCSDRQNKSTYETSSSRIPQTNYEVKRQMENSRDQLSACLRSDLFMTDKDKDERGEQSGD